MAEQPYPARFYGNPVGPANPGPGVPLPEAEAPLPADVYLPRIRPAPAPAPAKLYYEGDVVEDGKGNQKILKEGTWQDHVSVGRDIKKSIIPAAIRGVTGVVTTPATGADLLAKGAEWAADKVLPEGAAKSYKDTSDAITNWTNDSKLGRAMSAVLGPSYKEAMEGIESKTGPLYHAQTSPGKFAQTAVEIAPAVLAGPGAWQAKLAQGAGTAFGSEALGQLSEGSSWEPAMRFLGGLLGAKSPAGVRQGVTPFAADADRTAMANQLRGRNIDVSAGQATGSGWLGGLENDLSQQALAPSKFKNLESNQGAQITREMMKESGSTAPTARGLAQRGDELGRVVEGLARRNDMMFDPQLRTDLNSALRDYNTARGVTGARGRNPVQDIINRINWGGSTRPPGPNITPMGLSGDQYQTLRSFLSNRAQAVASSDPDRAIAFRSVRDALDNTMERGLASRNSPDLGAWRDFRREWSAYQALSDAATVPGPQARLGILNPSHVHQAAQGNPLNKGLTDLSGAGEAILQPLPKRSPAQDLAASVGALGGMFLGSHGGANLEGGVLGLLGVPHMIRALINNPVMAQMVLSPAGQRYLANQRWLPGSGTTTNTGQMVRALTLKPPNEGEE